MNEPTTEGEETIILPTINTPRMPHAPQSRELVKTDTPERPDLPHAAFGGYQRDAVDAYLTQLEDALQDARQHAQELTATVNDLHAQHALMEQQVENAREDSRINTARIAELAQERDQARHDAQNSIAAMAEEQQAFVNSCRKRGQQLMDKAQTEYDAKLKQAGIDAQHTIQDAKEEAESILASAKHTSQNILDAAKQKSEAIDQRGTQIVEQAKQTAANMIADAQKQQDDIRHECAQQVADAQQETEHYQQLRDHILGELNDIATRLNQLPRTAAHPNKQ